MLGSYHLLVVVNAPFSTRLDILAAYLWFHNRSRVISRGAVSVCRCPHSSCSGMSTWFHVRARWRESVRSTFNIIIRFNLSRLRATADVWIRSLAPGDVHLRLCRFCTLRDCHGLADTDSWTWLVERSIRSYVRLFRAQWVRTVV